MVSHNFDSWEAWVFVVSGTGQNELQSKGCPLLQGSL